MQIPNAVTLPAKVYDILIGFEDNRPGLSKNVLKSRSVQA